MRTKIKKIFEEEKKSSIYGQTFIVCGWIKTLRNQKSFAFIEINDGSIFTNLQIILDSKIEDFAKIEKLSTGASIKVTGEIVESPGQNQKFEMRAEKLEILGLCPAEDYPLQKKRHSFEFLRTIAHLRPRTNTQGALVRVRNALAFATHEFFQKEGFFYIHTPIITSSDCEGGGELFRVTTLSGLSDETLKDGSLDYSKDFFNHPTFLTVSGQLNVEAFSCSLSDVYTFGPTFRAENSNTSRHLAEFWMVEPEMAFADLKEIIKNQEKYLKFVIQKTLERCEEDINFFDRFIEKGLKDRLTSILASPFATLSYTEAINVLNKASQKFEFPTNWGSDLQSEHERYLAENYCKRPVFIYDYPEKIKAFYMRQNDDGKTVAACDLLVPKTGELIGGSQREERYDILEQKIQKMNLPKEEYFWYLDLRKYGSVPHSGYGVGFERLVQFVTGLENIRDVIAYPRYVGHAKF